MTGPYAALLAQAPLPELLEQVNAHRGQLAETMGVQITDITEDTISATMPVAGNTQPVGLLHGGASAVLAETVGSIGAALHAGPARYPVGIELNCSHHSSARSGLVHAVARLAFDGLIPNVQASWVKLGLEAGARLLAAGCNDLGGTLMDETISRSAGAAHGTMVEPADLEAAIRGSGRVPQQRTTLYAAFDGDPVVQR